MSNSEYCSSSSQAAGESPLGRATAGIDAWVVIEINEPWAAKPLESEVFAGGRRAVLERWLADIPRSRLQLIRRPQSATAGVSLFLGSSEPHQAWLVRLRFANLDELFAVDVPALFAARGGQKAEAVDQLVLVCTHGKRDRCCAKFGVAIYNAAAAQSESVWQTTHVGGHRFAATAVVLPAGMCYGRLVPEDVGPWLEAESRGEIFDLQKVRGRTSYPAHVQAAEVLALEQLGLRDQGALELQEETQASEGCWVVSFRGAQGTVSVDVELRGTGAQCLGSCGDAELRQVGNLIRRAPE